MWFSRATEETPLLVSSTDDDTEDDSSYGILGRVAHTTISERSERLAKNAVLAVGFVWAVLNALGAGAITCFSIYGHILQEQRGYPQLHVNILSISAGVSMYLLVPIFGYLTDHHGPRWASLVSGVILGVSYLIAAFSFRSGIPSTFGGDGWPFWIMVLAFIGVGAGTGCMYLSGVSLCAKNFGQGENKGKAISIPIASFGLSGLCFSQIGSRVLYELTPDGSRGDVDVFKFFVFVSTALAILGIGGFFTLVIVDEDELINVRYENLAQSGILGDQARDDDCGCPFVREAMIQHGFEDMLDLTTSQHDRVQALAASLKQIQEEAQAAKKYKLLNVELTMFLTDKTMWLLSLGFLCVTGPGETYINNIGSIIRSLYPANIPSSALPTTAATHISIVAVSSSISRLLMGVLSDMISPSQKPPSIDSIPIPHRRTISRVVFLIISAIFLAIGQMVLASGAATSNGTALSVVSAFIGAGYGAVFALVPIIVSAVWGVENFGTNWGLVAMTPAVGATLWGLIYAYYYEIATNSGSTSGSLMSSISSSISKLELRDGTDKMHQSICYGKACYNISFWLMMTSSTMACVFWLVAWRGSNGWKSRKIAV